MTVDRPNTLFIFADQQHWQALGCQDGFFETPHLDRLAAEGTLFERAFCTTPQCSPSRSTMLTGLYPTSTGVLGNVGAAGGQPLRLPTIAPRLQALGYRTGYFGKWHLGKSPVATSGWDEEHGVIGRDSHDDEDTTTRAVDFLRRQTGRSPFALFLSYEDPHDVYHFDPDAIPDVSDVPLPESWHQQDFAEVPAVQAAFMMKDQGTRIEGRDPDVWRAYHHFYREKVRRYDGHVGRVLAALEVQGLAEDTVVVATSDHGDMDTHHRLIFKGPFMYDHMVRVPLIVRVPAAYGGVSSRRVHDIDVVHTDLVPTLLDFCGADVADVGDGTSLRPLLTGAGPGPDRPYVIGQYYSKQRWVNPVRMIRTSEYKYNFYRIHGEELYDLRNDPHETVNLVDDPGWERVKRELVRELNHWIERHNDPFYRLPVTDRAGRPFQLSGGSL